MKKKDFSVPPDYQKKLIKLHDHFPISRLLGMTLQYSEKGESIVTLPFHSNNVHLYGIGGGVAALLMDHAGFFVAIPHSSHAVSTIDLSIRFLEPLGKQDLQAIGRIIRYGRKIIVLELEVRTMEGKQLAIGSAGFTPTPVPFEI